MSLQTAPQLRLRNDRVGMDEEGTPLPGKVLLLRAPLPSNRDICGEWLQVVPLSHTQERAAYVLSAAPEHWGQGQKKLVASFSS